MRWPGMLSALLMFAGIIVILLDFATYREAGGYVIGAALIAFGVIGWATGDRTETGP